MRKLTAYWFEIALACAGLLVIGLGLGGLLVGAHLGASEARAQIGDFVGGTTTPILTALTFIGVLIGIALQRRELIATRKELKRSAKALENQDSHLEKQRLSRSFFDLFEMYKSVVADMSVGSEPNRYTGKEALRNYAFLFFPFSSSGSRIWSVDNVLEKHSRYNPNLGNYFRIIFRLLVFLSENGKNGNFYADMFRAQLSTPELYLLFFNCISKVGRPLEKYAIEFELFDNMPIPDGQNFEVIVNCLDRLSFGSNTALLELSQENSRSSPSR